MTNETGSYQPTEADKFSAQLGPMTVESGNRGWEQDPQERNRARGRERDRVAEKLAEGRAEIAAVSEITNQSQVTRFIREFEQQKFSKLDEIGKKYGAEIDYDDHRGSGDMDHFDIDGEWISRDEIHSVETYLHPETYLRPETSPEVRTGILQRLEKKYGEYPKDLLEDLVKYRNWYLSDTGRTLDAAVVAGIIAEEKAGQIREAEENGKIVLSNGMKFRSDEMRYGHGRGGWPFFGAGKTYMGEQLWYVIAEPKKPKVKTGESS